MGTCTTLNMLNKLPGKHVGGRATIRRGIRPKRQRVRANEPFDVWILEKVWVSDTNAYERSDCFAFNSFRAANRAMFDDWTEEYMERPDAPEDDDNRDFNEDQFWCQQSRPSEEDDESEINFRDGSSIKWRICNRSIEGLSPMCDDKDEQHGSGSNEKENIDMKIKHWQGYGTLNAKKLSSSADTLIVEVWGNHEWGLERNNMYDVFNWLVKKFDPSRTLDEFKTMKMKSFVLNGEDHCIYTIHFRK